MNNLPFVKIGVIVAFIQIAFQIAFLCIGVNSSSLLINYLRLPLSIFSLVAYVILIYFLRATLIYFNEKQAIINAFSIYLVLNVVFFLVNTAISYLTKNYHLFSYTLTVYYIFVLYIAIQSFRVSQPVIKGGFVLLAVFLLVVTLINLAFPAVFNFFNVDYHFYAYIHIVSVLPLIASIIIFNSVNTAGIKTGANFTDKFSFKDDPFNT